MNFGLITEGASEHRIIKHLLTRYFRDDAPLINQIQPKIINEKQETPGGWHEVLKYCERDELKSALIENDYLIIQIDTDQSPIKPFDIPHSDSSGKSKPLERLHSEVVEKLTGMIKEEIHRKYEGKIFFAVCIHTIECWLLPVYYDESKATSVNGCLSILNKALGKQNIHPITSRNKNGPNGARSYNAILGNLKKKKDIDALAQYNPGFKKFIDSLKAIQTN